MAVKYDDELQLKLQRLGITSDTDFATSDPFSIAHQQVSHTNSAREEMLNNNSANNGDHAFESAESRRVQSLPHIYDVTVNPSVDNEDGEIWKYVHV